jgi:WD40 repeat protein
MGWRHYCCGLALLLAGCSREAAAPASKDGATVDSRRGIAVAAPADQGERTSASTRAVAGQPDKLETKPEPAALNWAKAVEVAKLGGHRGATRVAFLPDSNRLVSADGSRVRLWDVAAGKELKKTNVAKEGQGLAALAVSRDGKKVVVGGYQFLALLDVPSLEVRHRQDLQKGMNALDVRSLALSPDGRSVLAGGLIDDRVLYDDKGNYRKGIDKATRNVILVRDTETWKDQQRLPIGPDHCYRLAYLPDGRRALVAFDEFEVTLVDLPSARKIRKYAAIRRFRAGGLAVSPDGTRFLFAQQSVLTKGAKESVLLYEVESGKKLREFHVPEFGVGANVNNFDEVAFSPDGRYACFVGRHKLDLTSKQYAVAPVFDVAAWKEVARFHFPRIATFGGVTFSPDGRLLAVSGGGHVSVYRAAKE